MSSENLRTTTTESNNPEQASFGKAAAIFQWLRTFWPRFLNSEKSAKAVQSEYWCICWSSNENQPRGSFSQTCELLKTCSKSSVNSYANACSKQAANQWFLTHHSHNNGKQCSQRGFHVNTVSLINYFTTEIGSWTYPQLFADIFA